MKTIKTSMSWCLLFLLGGLLFNACEKEEFTATAVDQEIEWRAAEEAGDKIVLWNGFTSGINDRGQVIGNQVSGWAFNDKAMLWDGRQAKVLWPNGHAADLNKQGMVAGFSWDRQGQYSAMLWDGYRPRTLWENGAAYLLNDRGQAIGSATANNRSVAMLWDGRRAHTLWTGLANAINNRGQVVGMKEESYTDRKAMLWDGRRATELWEGTAYAINDRGQVVGEKFNPAGGTILMLWDGGRAMELGEAWTGSGGGGFGPHPAILTEKGLVLWESAGILKLWDGHQVRTFWRGWLNDMVEKGMFVATKLGGDPPLQAVLWDKGRERMLWSGSAFDLNNKGQVAGASANGTAMFWNGRQAIELWPGDARQLNDKGQVAGHEGGGSHAKAVLWTPKPTGPPDWRLQKPKA